ncbi:ABC-type Fe3+ transport system, periplasmic component [gamma proteobacterium HdN1]|nr:ABC-type Fe3+ transport system, periplasmic component [gamma proteobacterium HdN1]
MGEWHDSIHQKGIGMTIQKWAMAAAAATLAGFAGWAQAAELNIYSARKEELIRPLLEKFSKKTGIGVNVVTADDDVLIQRLKAEGRNTPADILIMADAGRLVRAAQADLFQPVKSSILNKNIPAQLRQADGLWFGLTIRARVIAYSPERVKPGTLSSYENLADPQWKGRICSRSSGNVYNQSLTASMIANDGAEKTDAWLKGMVANFARPPQGGDRDQIKDIAAGKCDVALVNTYYIGGMMQSKDPAERDAVAKVAIFWPNQADRGAHINVSGAGVIKNAKHRKEAIRLLEYMVTDQSQEWYAEANSEFPIREDVPKSKILAGWGEFKADALPISALGELNSQAVMAMDKAGWR